jgi:DNA-binding transcriptional LysR family regulator
MMIRSAKFARDYPDVSLELTTTEESRLDFVGAGFDAGIHLGEFVERDMVAVRVSKEQQAAIVGAQSYFASHPKPQSPRDLPAHRCINFRHGSSGVYHWEFDKGRKSLSVAVNGPLTVDDVDILIRAAVDGVGLAFALEEHVATQLAKGTLLRVPRGLVPAVCGVLLVLPQPPAAAASALGALIEALRL